MAEVWPIDSGSGAQWICLYKPIAQNCVLQIQLAVE